MAEELKQLQAKVVGLDVQEAVLIVQAQFPG